MNLLFLKRRTRYLKGGKIQEQGGGEMKGQGNINVGKIRLFLENKFREETILGDPFFFYNYFVSPLFG